MPRTEMPIFTRTFDLLGWLVPATNHFPRNHRFTITQRLLNAAFDLGERLEEANARHGRQFLERLRLADEALGKLRYYLRLCHRWGWLSAGQYQHVAEMVDEIGRLLGGWQKVTALRQFAASCRCCGDRSRQRCAYRNRNNPNNRNNNIGFRVVLSTLIACPNRQYAAGQPSASRFRR